jgi:methylated-DNA-[protein]-cysteine S-methyltransferase
MVLSASLGARPVLYEAPGWGVGELWLDGDTVVWHEAPTAGRAAEDGRRHPLADRLVRFFRGEPDPFDDVELDLEELSPFHRELADALRRVPRGQVVSYGELAALAGRPNAQRAAGTFCATNRLAIFVPCHRVVAADGIGSYGSLGVDYKRRLLALEGVAL